MLHWGMVAFVIAVSWFMQGNGSRLVAFVVRRNLTFAASSINYTSMKFGVVVFPGSNCDRDMIGALRNDMGQEVTELWHKDKDLGMFTTDDCIVLPGGFSFGDYLRCGAIAKFSPMMQAVIEFANKGGKVLGCMQRISDTLRKRAAARRTAAQQSPAVRMQKCVHQGSSF